MLIERLANLLRSEMRAQGKAMGLQPVQIEALFYLSICNRYSDTPQAVADYLGLTKGTVSQTLNVLESRGLMAKQRDVTDKRLVHLALTREGMDFLTAIAPPPDFSEAVDQVPKRARQGLEQALKTVLFHYQNQSGRAGFGVCKNCQYNATKDGQFFCGLTQEFLEPDDTELICREFTLD